MNVIIPAHWSSPFNWQAGGSEADHFPWIIKWHEHHQPLQKAMAKHRTNKWSRKAQTANISWGWLQCSTKEMHLNKHWNKWPLGAGRQACHHLYHCVCGSLFWCQPVPCLPDGINIHVSPPSGPLVCWIYSADGIPPRSYTFHNLCIIYVKSKLPWRLIKCNSCLAFVIPRWKWW